MLKALKKSKKIFTLFLASLFVVGGIFINQTTAQAIGFPWASVAWKVASYLNSYFYNVSGTTDIGTYYANISTGSLKFNDSSSNVGASVYHDLTFTTSNQEVALLAETNLLNFLGKISIILTDSSGNDKINKSVSNNQASYYKTSYYDNFGTWRARFVENDSDKWNCWVSFTDWNEYYGTYAMSINESGTIQSAKIAKTKDKIYFLPDSNHKSKEKKVYSGKLSMKDLSNEFFDSVNNRYVQSSKNFSVGDKILFKDVIKSIAYDSSANATYFVFDGLDNEKITWAFANDLTDKYKAGDSLSLKFNLVEENNINGVIFENIDYIVNAQKSYSIGQFVDINNYK